MRTTRVTGVALSIAALLLVAMAPPASATCAAYSGKLKGTYAFRLAPAKGFDADLATNGSDPGQVGVAPRQNVLRVGVFTSDGCGNITYGHTFATTDTSAGDTWLLNFTWTGAYTLNADLTGTLNTTPNGVNGACTSGAPPYPYACCTGPGTGTCPGPNWICTDTTVASPTPNNCGAGFVGNEEQPESYSISVSTTNGRVEFSETDDTGGGAKIFMVGEAIKQ